MTLFRCTIPGRAGILKNSKQIVISRKTGKRFVKSSDRYEAWAHKALLHIKQEACKMLSTINFPVNMKAVFYFENHAHEADLSNLYAGCEDLLQAAGVIANDKLIYGHNGSTKLFGQEARVDIELTKFERNE